MRKKKLKTSDIFEKVCVQLIFLLSAVLVLLLGIRTAGKTIEFAQAEKIEIINNMVEGLSESSKMKVQSKKLQNTIYKYLEAFVKAVAGFEFMPRNDVTVLPQIINSLPEETEILSFVYHGRNLTIRTSQSNPIPVIEMAENLEKRIKKPEEFEKVVYSYYIDDNHRCIAEITLIAHHYDENDLGDELEKRFFPNRSEKTQQEE